MSIYGKDYESYYRNLRRNGMRSQAVKRSIAENKDKNTTKVRRNNKLSIIVYDIIGSCILILFMIVLKNINYSNTQYVYESIDAQIKEDDDNLKYINDIIVDKAQNIYYSLADIINELGA